MPLRFRPLPPGVAQRMIQDVQDELTPMADQQMASIKGMPCPRCHDPMSPHLDARFIFGDGVLPRTLAKCQSCGATVDPRTNVVLEVGDPRKVTDPLPIVRPGED